MKLGIVGLPNVGKSTLFNAITKAGAEVANYAFCTIEPNVGVVNVPDTRLDVLAAMYHPEKITPATVSFVDIAGLVKGASRGEGLGNKFLSHIREVDAICHVVRCFEDDDIINVNDKIDPVSDFETVELELILADIEHTQKRLDKTARMAKGNDKVLLAEKDFLSRVLTHLEASRPARTFVCGNEAEEAIFASLFLLTAKPLMVIANVKETDAATGNKYTEMLQKHFAGTDVEVIIISAKIEAELRELDAEEATMFLQDLGLSESGLNKVIRSGYSILGLISFLTAGPKEVRAWTIKRETKAPQAAGVIHSDFERGFIRAEIVSYAELVASGSILNAKEKGLVRSEGKDYIMQDGDVVVFRFNV